MTSEHSLLDYINDPETLSQFFDPNNCLVSAEEDAVAQNGSLSDFFENFGGQLENAGFVDSFAAEAAIPSLAMSTASFGQLPAVQQANAGTGYQSIPAANQSSRIVALNVPAAQSSGSPGVSQQMVYYNGVGSRNILVQSANSASPVVLQSGTATNIVSRSAVQQSVTPSPGTMHIQCVSMPASGISVVPQPAGGSAAPVQQIRVLQAASAQHQVVQQQQQYQVIQQQPQQQVNLGATQGSTGLTLIQTASGQLLLHQPQVLDQADAATGGQPQVVINNSNQQQVNYGNVQGVQLGGGIQLQSAVAAQPVVLQQQNVTPSNRNIIVQTLPVVSAANSPAANVIHLGQLSGGGTVTHQTPASSLNQSSRPSASQSTEQNGVLVQIGGQTYRMQGVQQVQVANAVRPAQQIQRHIAPATPSQPSVLTRQINMAAASQLPSVSKQATPANTSHPSSATVSGQTITLTPSQLALLKQTPPEKQLGMIQMFQRQMAQRSAIRPVVSSGSISAVVSPMKTVQMVSSVASSSPLQRTPLSAQTARLSAPTIIRAGPPIAVRVGQNPSSATAGNTQSVGLQVLRPKPTSEMNTTDSSVVAGRNTSTKLTIVQPIVTSTPAVLPQNSSVAAGVGMQTRIVTSVAAVGQSVAATSTSASFVTTGTVSTATVAAGTTIHLTAHQQALLTRVQGQLKALAANPSRTPEQERFLHLLVNAQQQIHAQGRSQMQAALAASKTVSSSAAVVSLTTTPVKPTTSVNVLPAATGPVTSTACISTASITSTSTVEQLYEMFPHLKEKLEAQLAKIPAERREWFVRNQAAIFAKLQQQHRLQSANTPTTAASADTKTLAAASLNQTQTSSGAKIIVSGPLSLSAAIANNPALKGTRKQRFQLQLSKEQRLATECDTKTPFNGHKDVLRRLAVFHVCQTRDDSHEHIEKAEATYEEQCRLLLDKKEVMMTKYRQLLLLESMRLEPTANDVMLGRIFVNEERQQLKEDMRLAAEDPASFVPRPVLRDETIEDQQNVIEEMVDEKVECGDEDEVEDLEETVSAEAGSSYTVHPSGRLTLVFKNSPQHSWSPANSPAMPSADSKPGDAVRDVRVKLERCDESDTASTTPSKRSRLDDGSETSLPASPLQRLKSDTKDTVPLSEDDAAVAGLLGCASVCDEYISDTTNETTTHFGQLHDGLDVDSTDTGSTQYDVFSAAKMDLKKTTEHLSENGIDPTESTVTLDSNGGLVRQTETSYGEVMTAVDSLMADLIQLNAETSGNVRTVIPNGSVYLPSSATKISLAKRTFDTNVAVTRSLDGASLSDGMSPAVDGSALDGQQPHHLDNATHSSWSFAFCNKFATSDHEPDLDAAVKSILS